MMQVGEHHQTVSQRPGLCRMSGRSQLTRHTDKLLAFHMDYDKALNTSPYANELSDMVHAYNLNTWPTEARGWL